MICKEALSFMVFNQLHQGCALRQQPLSRPSEEDAAEDSFSVVFMPDH